MNKFLLIALVACSLGFHLQYVESEKAFREPAVNDAISETVNDFEARQDTLAGASDAESEDLEDEEGNTEDDIDEELTPEDEGEEESEEMGDEDEEFEDDDDDYRDEDDDEDEDEDLKNRYLDISPNKAIKMNTVSVNKGPC